MAASRRASARISFFIAAASLTLRLLLLLRGGVARGEPNATAAVQYVEPPPGIFTTDASLAVDTHAVVEDTSEDVYTLKELETAAPGLLNRLRMYETPRGEFHMTPVRAVHARAVADMPVYDTVYDRFISSLGSQDSGGVKGFTAVMDGVNTASVEGALLYVQRDVINQFGRTVTTRCRRKHDVRFLVFYELLIAQPNASLASFQRDVDRGVFEYGPYADFDHGRCTPAASELGQDVFPDVCYTFNGNQGRPRIGAYVGAKRMDSEPLALYKDAYWFSFPNACPLQPWTAKTAACRAQTSRGLCPPGKQPDGVHCTYTHNILGFLPLDDLVGITAIVNEVTGVPFANFSEFCRFGNVEFEAFEGFDYVLKNLPFWEFPLDTQANARRTQQMIDAYQKLASPTGHSPQIFPRLREKMKLLPPLDELRDQNPPCYETVRACVDTAFGCKRETYAQICRLCTTLEKGCVKPPPTFAFPALERPRAASSQETDGDDPSENAAAATRASVAPWWLAVAVAVAVLLEA